MTSLIRSAPGCALSRSTVAGAPELALKLIASSASLQDRGAILRA
jgi:hypothetical protein